LWEANNGRGGDCSNGVREHGRDLDLERVGACPPSTLLLELASCRAHGKSSLTAAGVKEDAVAELPPIRLPGCDVAGQNQQ